MEELEIYEKYFREKNAIISRILNAYKDNNKTIALWGAGMRGKAFLNAFDIDNKVIDFVYDLDENKYGICMESGHMVVDYHTNQADVVLIANCAFEFEVIHLLEQEKYSAKIINIDNIILGNIDAETILHPQELNLYPVRKVKICALVIMYNPEDDIVENIKSYASDVEKLYVYDNSEIRMEHLIAQIKEVAHVEYIYSGKNNGLAVPINEIARLAINSGFDWLFTFDQDSKACDNMISAMREFANSEYCDDTIGIIAPVTNEIDCENSVQEIYCTYFDKVVQSGAMNRLTAWKNVNGFDENLFIEQVDYEYCARLTTNGYKIVKLNTALLMHNQQDNKVQRCFVDGKQLFLNKYPPVRYYYRYRNSLYCYHKYKTSNPIYALNCLNVLKKIRKSVILEQDSEIYEKAIQLAEKDYKNGVMGKFQGGI